MIWHGLHLIEWSKALPTPDYESLPSFASLPREAVAKSEGVCVDTLKEMHRRGDAPPRYKVSQKRTFCAAAATGAIR
jgi:hypothetical protein